MKKLLILLTCLSFGIFSANAQEAFKHLSVGFEAGSTGAGIELALPVVSNHLVLKAGYQFPNINFDINTDFDLSSINGEFNSYAADANNALQQLGKPERIELLPNSTPVKGLGTMSLGAFKAMLEYYPFKKSSFHLTVGLYVGTEDNILNLDLQASELARIIEQDKAIAKQYESELKQLGLDEIPAANRATLNGKTYQFGPSGEVNLGVQIAKARPYVGLGFGRSIPKTHLGFQFDLGAWYHGTPGLSSKNEVAFVPSAPEMNYDFSAVESICVYPQISFRLIWRIF